MEKARLITDMMYKMQGKYVDSQLRNIGRKDPSIKVKTGSEAPDFDQEDLRFGSGQGRQRAGSNYEKIETREYALALSDEQGKQK